MKNNGKNTLETPRVAALLARLFAESTASESKAGALLATLSPEARSDYRTLYARAKDLSLSVSPETARLLYLLARTTQAKAIVEFGTSFGLSAVHCAAALRDNGGGRLIGSELEPGKVATARANLAEAGLDDLVEVRDGDAIETLAKDLPASIDLVLMDGHKPLYPRVLALLEPHLRPGACIVADNVEMSPAYLARVRQAGGPYLSMPFVEGVELSIKL